MESNNYHNYLKYKKKYLDLKNNITKQNNLLIQIGGECCRIKEKYNGINSLIKKPINKKNVLKYLISIRDEIDKTIDKINQTKNLLNKFKNKII